MPVYVVTGKLGSGKTLISVGKAAEYAQEGRRIAANFAMDFSTLSRRPDDGWSNTVVHVIPPRPCVDDLRALGIGGPTEDKAGLLILDECAVFLNSREWNHPDRKGVIDWFLHARKLKWDIILIVQHQSMIDKQVRESICEMLVVCRRMDRMKLPIISWFVPVKAPRLHLAQVRYGLGQHDPMAERWTYKGDHLFPCYSTEAIFDVEQVGGSYSVLPPRLSRWRYEPAPVPLRERALLLVRRLLEGPPAPSVEPRPKHRLAELLMRLPEPDRLKHWRKLDQMGAFSGSY